MNEPETPGELVYLDHGATSWPKAPGVAEAVTRALELEAGNPGRAAHRMALDASRLIYGTRSDCAAFLGVRDARDLIFTSGTTLGMNLLLKGLVRPGDRVVTTSMEHNAVARPLNLLASRGVEVVVVQADETGFVDPDDVERAVRAAPTKAVVCQHASNVSGTIQPIADIADVAHVAGAVLLVDGAQGAGHLPVDLASLGADGYATSGHKALLGPQGTGLLYIAPGLDVEELVQGGSGSESEEPLQPTARPDRYEAGTPNTPGIAGLGVAVRFLAAEAEHLRAEERRLTRLLIEGLAAIPGLRILGPPAEEDRVPIVSVVHERLGADEIAFALDRRFGVEVRSGLHCAPWAHTTLGTMTGGAVRFGVGYGVTDDGIDRAVRAMEALTT